ncbi:hypothetical protein GW17_00040460 [Ensete ventricosum]|nr:hypothetical protein GW17_00040460 [Ensete ventricosum]
MSQKRQPEEGEVGASSDGSGSPDEKRQKIRFHGDHSFRVVKEAMQMHRIQKCLAAMEPLIRKIVRINFNSICVPSFPVIHHFMDKERSVYIREEVDLALSKHLASITR